MHVRIWELIGIVILFGVLIWGACRILSKWPFAQNCVIALLVVFAVVLALMSLGIMPSGTGITVSP